MPIPQQAWLILAGLGCFGAEPPQPAGDADSRTTASGVRLHFPEDHDRRSVADVRLATISQSSTFTLVMVVSAPGGTIDPPAGFEHMRGSNAITARELRTLYESGAIAICSTNLLTGDQHWGAVQPGRTASLPRRRLLPDGRVEISQRPPQMVEMLLTSSGLPSGLYRVDLLASGQSRLRLLVATVRSHGLVVGVDPR